MKKYAIILLAVSLMTGCFNQAEAQENGMNGLLLGAGSGALIGQAIGRNTEATLIGTAVGTMLGYIAGNEMDKTGGVRVRSAYPPAYSYPPPPIRYRPGYHHSESLPGRRHAERVCRETEMLATIDNRPEKIFGVACLENGEWVFQSDNVNIAQTIIIEEDDDWYKHKRRTAHFKRRGKQYRNHPGRGKLYYRSVW